MLHQPTPRADLVVWLQDTLTVLAMIGADTVLVGEPFGPAAAVLIENGISVHPVAALSEGSPVEPVDSAEEDIALLQLTSGSTGIPKAVAISHRNLDQTIRAMAEAAKVVDPTTEVMVNWLPLFHDMGLIGFLVAPMAVGVESVCITPTEFLKSPLLWPALITKYGGTMTAAPNFAYTVLARRLNHAADDAYDLSSLRFVLNGAEPIDNTTITTFLESAGRFGLKETALIAAYGMAEATLAVSFTNPGDTISVDSVDTQAIETAARAQAQQRQGHPQLRQTRLPAARYRTPRRRRSRLSITAPSDRRIRNPRGRGHAQLSDPRRKPKCARRRRMARNRGPRVPHRNRRDRGVRPKEGHDHPRWAQHLPHRHRTRGRTGRGGPAG